MTKKLIMAMVLAYFADQLAILPFLVRLSRSLSQIVLNCTRFTGLSHHKRERERERERERCIEMNHCSIHRESFRSTKDRLLVHTQLPLLTITSVHITPSILANTLTHTYTYRHIQYTTATLSHISTSKNGDKYCLPTFSRSRFRLLCVSVCQWMMIIPFG